MAQVTLYLDRETAARVDKAATAAGLSKSRWLAELVRERTATEWPADVAQLAGAWSEFPDAAELRAGAGQDLPREAL